MTTALATYAFERFGESPTSADALTGRLEMLGQVLEVEAILFEGDLFRYGETALDLAPLARAVKRRLAGADGFVEDLELYFEILTVLPKLENLSSVMFACDLDRLRSQLGASLLLRKGEARSFAAAVAALVKSDRIHSLAPGRRTEDRLLRPDLIRMLRAEADELQSVVRKLREERESPRDVKSF